MGSGLRADRMGVRLDIVWAWFGGRYADRRCRGGCGDGRATVIPATNAVLVSMAEKQ